MELHRKLDTIIGSYSRRSWSTGYACVGSFWVLAAVGAAAQGVALNAHALRIICNRFSSFLVGARGVWLGAALGVLIAFPARPLELPRDLRSIGALAATSATVQRIAALLETAPALPNDITGLAAIHDLLLSESIQSNELRSSLGSLANLERYLRRLSPVVAPLFCTTLGLPEARCEEFDCLTQPRPAELTGSSPRICSGTFDGPAMPTAPAELTAWIQSRLPDDARRAAWQRAVSQWAGSNGQVLPIRERAVQIRAFLANYRIIIANDLEQIRSRLSRESGPAAVAEGIASSVLQRESERQRFQARVALLDELVSSRDLAALMLSPAGLAQANESVAALRSALDNNPYGFLQPTRQMRSVLEATASLEDEVRAKIGDVSVTVATALAAAGQAANRVRAPLPVSGGASPCRAENDVLIKIADGAPASLFLTDIVSTRENGPTSARLGLGFAMDGPVTLSVTAPGANPIVLNRTDCGAPSDVPQRIRIVDLGVIIPIERAASGLFALRVQPGNLIFQIDSDALLGVVRGIAPARLYVDLEQPRIHFAGSDLRDIELEFTVRVRALDFAFQRRVPLVSQGRVNAQIERDIADLAPLRDAATARLRSLTPLGEVQLGPAIRLTNATVPDDGAELRLRGTVHIADLPPFQATLSLQQAPNGSWGFVPSTSLPEDFERFILRRLLDSDIARLIVRQIAALQPAAAEALQQTVGIANLRLTATRKIVFDLHLSLSSQTLIVRNLEIDPVNLPDSFSRVAIGAAEQIARESAAVIQAHIETISRALIDAAAAELDRLVNQVNGSSFDLLGISAKLNIAQTGTPRAANLVLTLDDGSNVTISGLRLRGFSQDGSRHLPRLEVDRINLSDRDRERIEKAISSKIRGLVGVSWLRDLTAKVELSNTALTVTLTATELPLVGAYRFPPIRIDLSTGAMDLNADQIQQSLRAALLERLALEIDSRIHEILPEEIRAIVREIRTSVTGQDFRVNGRIEFQGITGNAEIVLKIEGGRFTTQVNLSYDANLESLLQQFVTRTLGGRITITSRLSNRPEIRFDVSDVPIGGDTFRLSATGVSFTPAGLQLDGLGLVIPVEIPVPPTPFVIARPRVHVNFRGERRFVIGGDLTLTGQRNLYRVEGELQGLIDRQIIRLVGTTVLADVLPVFESTGEIRLRDQQIETRSRSIGLLRAVFPTDQTSTLDVRQQRITQQTEAAVLGVRVAGQATIDIRHQSIDLTGAVHLPFVQDIEGGLGSDIFLTNPRLTAHGSASLIGLTVGFDLNADYRRAELAMRAAGIRVTVIVPGPRELTRALLERILENLLKPSFDLDALRRLEIVINLIPPGRDSSGSPQAPPAGGQPPGRTDGQPGGRQAPATGAQPDSPRPQNSYVRRPDQGIVSDWEEGYVAYPLNPQYYCFSRWRRGSSAQPSCWSSQIVSRSIAEFLGDPRVRYVSQVPGSFPHPSCRLGTECQDAELSPVSEIMIARNAQGQFVAFPGAHNGKLEQVPGSPALQQILGASAADYYSARLSSQRSTRIVSRLIGFEAEALIFGRPDFGIGEPRQWYGDAGIWAFERRTSDVQMTDRELQLVFVDLNNDSLLSFPSGYGFGRFLAALMRSGPADHALRPLFAEQLRGNPAFHELWSSDQVALLVRGDSFFYSDLQALARPIRLTLGSNVPASMPASTLRPPAFLAALTRIRAPLVSTASTRDPSRPDQRLLAAVASLLATDRAWSEIRLDLDADVAVVGADLDSENWRVGLAFRGAAAGEGRAAAILASADARQRMSGCWTGNGWIRQQSVAWQKLNQPREAGRFLAAAMTMDSRGWLEQGFRVSPRRLLDPC